MKDFLNRLLEESKCGCRRLFLKTLILLVIVVLDISFCAKKTPSNSKKEHTSKSNIVVENRNE